MNTLYSSYDLAKERHADLLREAHQARLVRAARGAGRGGSWRRLAFTLAALTAAAAVTAARVLAAGGGGGGGGGRHFMY